MEGKRGGDDTSDWKVRKGTASLCYSFSSRSFWMIILASDCRRCLRKAVVSFVHYLSKAKNMWSFVRGEVRRVASVWTDLKGLYP